MYEPVVEVSTVPEVVIEAVRSPSTSSVAVAPRSIQLSPKVICREEGPFNVITGGVASGIELTITVLVTDTKLFPLSKTEYTSVYVPVLETSTVPEVVIEAVISPSSWSVAIHPSSV